MEQLQAVDEGHGADEAWAQFEALLKAHLASFEPETADVIEIEIGEEGGVPRFVQFCGLEDDGIRMEVSGNQFLDPAHQLDEAGQQQLRDLGFNDPDEDDPNPYLECGPDGIDDLAGVAVRVLREVLKVAHPSVLRSDPFEIASDAKATTTDDKGNTTFESEDADPLDESLLIAVQPRGPAHLRQLVDEALTPLFDGSPPHDGDGDIPVVVGSSIVFVRVRENEPIVELLSILILDVTNLQQAAIETSILNRDADFIRYLVDRDRVIARVCIPSFPFLPMQLRWMLGVMSTTLDAVDDDLALRVGGRVWRPQQDGPGGDPGAGPHPAVTTLRELETESPGSVDPELAARVCGNDRDLILQLIATTSQQEANWRQAREEALARQDAPGADAARHESEQAENTANLLRRALRVVVTTHSAASPDGHSYGGSTTYEAPGYL